MKRYIKTTLSDIDIPNPIRLFIRVSGCYNMDELSGSILKYVHQTKQAVVYDYRDGDYQLALQSTADPASLLNQLNNNLNSYLGVTVHELQEEHRAAPQVPHKYAYRVRLVDAHIKKGPAACTFFWVPKYPKEAKLSMSDPIKCTLSYRDVHPTDNNSLVYVTPEGWSELTSHLQSDRVLRVENKAEVTWPFYVPPKNDTDR